MIIYLSMDGSLNEDAPRPGLALGLGSRPNQDSYTIYNIYIVIISPKINKKGDVFVITAAI